MALVSGTKLGPHEIVAPLGAGGMGEVYRARDARLGREVAIRILPHHLASNPQLRERFDREARAISSLNQGDGKSVLLAEPTGHEFIVNIVNLADGRRTLWKQLKSESGDASRFVVTPDLKYYAFTVPRYSSVLNIVSGLH
jgi:serine/threonine protein kinase